MTFPVIGVTTMRSKNQYGTQISSLAVAYVEALSQTGVCPVLIPNQMPLDAVDDMLEGLDGVLFTGGGDVDADFYQAEDHPMIKGVERDRDELELRLLERVIQEGKPFLGICRGQQVINVGLGGTLYADIEEQVLQAEKHDYFPDWKRDHLAHTVTVEAGSQLASILGSNSSQVNSLHHQAIDRLAPDLVATAHAPDGIIEAVELPGHPFGLAVQWHPEWLTSLAAMRSLFTAFAQAANQNSK